MANLRVDKITSTETFETTGSVQFDGANDHLDVGSAGDFNYLHDNTASFTAEFWVYPQLLNSRQTIFSTGGNSSSTGFCVRIMASGDAGSSNGYLVGAQTSKSSGGNYLYWDSDSTQLAADTWYHIAIVYDNTDETLKIYVNGKLTNSGFPHVEGTFGSHSTSNSSHSLHIGEEPYNNALDLTGHISNLRILNGVKLYTSNFKPPMRELEVTPETTLLCCQSKTDAILEKTGKTITANGNAVASELTPGILTPVPKAGAGSAITGSVEFDGTRDYLTSADNSDFAMGTGDLTIESWIYASDNADYRTIFDTSSSGQGGSNSNGIRFGVDNSGSAYIYTNGFLVTASSAITEGCWNHVAYTRSSGTHKLFVNGVERASSTTARDYTNDSCNIGTDQGNSELWKGYISNLRVIKGTALYTDDFIPPTRELKKVPGTVLLCCQDPDNPLTEATGKTITGYGDLQRADGVELITNGTFNSDVSNWTATDCTLTYSSGQMQVTRSGGGGLTANQAFTTVAGNKYNLSGTINSSGSRGDLRVYNGSGTGGSNIITLFGTNGAVTDLRGTFIASSTLSTVVISVDVNSTSVTVDNISVTLAEGSNKGSNFTPQVGDDRKVTFEGVTKINSDAYFYLPTGDTASRETTGTYNAGTRGIFGGGFVGPGSSDHRDTIQFINIATLGDAIDAGDLTVSRYGNAALASATRAVWAGGIVPSPAIYNTIDAVEIMSTGNAFDFGDLPTAVYYPAGFSNRTRGIYSGGASPTLQATLSYITISSKGNTQDFGDMGDARNSHSSFGSPTRGIVAGGWISPVRTNTMEYVTIATTGNAKDFGDLTRAQNYAGGLSSAIRGLVGGGNAGNPSSVSDIIDYVTISAMGNAQDFGDLTSARTEIGCCSSATRGVFAGAWSPSKVNTIDYVSIQTTGNAKDFGDLVNIGVMQEMGTSNGHGGLG